MSVTIVVSDVSYVVAAETDVNDAQELVLNSPWRLGMSFGLCDTEVEPCPKFDLTIPVFDISKNIGCITFDHTT